MTDVFFGSFLFFQVCVIDTPLPGADFYFNSVPLLNPLSRANKKKRVLLNHWHLVHLHHAIQAQKRCIKKGGRCVGEIILGRKRRSSKSVGKTIHFYDLLIIRGCGKCTESYSSLRS